jgi:Predicted signal transduction protein with a C-terminal ATPase domain
MGRRLVYLLMLFCLPVLPVPAADSFVESELAFRRFTTLDGLPQMQTEVVWQDTQGYIYIGTLSGFVRYDGRTLTPFLRGQRENIVSFREVDAHVRAQGFVRQWDVRGEKAGMLPVDPQGELLLNNLNAADLPAGYILLEDRQEQNRMLCRLDQDGNHPVLSLPLLDQMTPDRKMYLDSAYVYVPTPQGLYIVEDGQVRRVTRKSDVFSLLRTGMGLLAFAADGIYQVQQDSLTLLQAHSFPDPDYGLSVRQDSRGGLYIADSHTVWHFDGTGLPHKLASGFNLVRGLFVDRWDRLWAATYQGAYCFFHCNFTGHRLTDGNDIVRAIAFCNGKQVLGTLNGKALVDGQPVSDLEGNFYAPGAAVLGGSVYLAGNGDVACIRNGALHWLGLPDDRYRFVTAAGGRLVIGSRSGMLAWDPTEQRLDTLTTQIAQSWFAADDGQGRIWASGNAGLYCLTDDGSGGTAIRKVRTATGAQVISTLSSDGRGRVCFAKADSLFLIENGAIRAMSETQSVLSGHEIRSVHLSPRGYLIAAAIDGLLVSRLDGQGRASDIHWFDGGNGFTTIEPLMAPMAEDDAGTVWLAGLEEMTSFDPGRLLSDNQASAVVPIPRPWWRRWWVLLSCTSLLLLCVWLAARRFERRRARRRMALLEREKQQKELQLSAVRLKSIPHFHANVLAGIEYFVTHNSPDEAARYLKLYSDFTNQTLADIDRPARTVQEEVNYVRSYLELEQLRYGDRLQYSVRVAPDVDGGMLLPTMLLHTYCENAVKHGIATKAGPGHVEVDIRRELRDGVEGLMVSVGDDGVGRAAAARAGVPSTKQGLKILQQQIDLYNQTNRHRILQQVTDLYDEAGRPAGTRFETWIPPGYQY